MVGFITHIQHKRCFNRLKGSREAANAPKELFSCQKD